jgi:hypothetical protein
MTQIPHPSNMTDAQQQQAHYLRQIAEQLARIGSTLEPGAQTPEIVRPENMTDPDQVLIFSLRQVTVQLARIADALGRQRPGDAAG